MECEPMCIIRIAQVRSENTPIGVLNTPHEVSLQVHSRGKLMLVLLSNGEIKRGRNIGQPYRLLRSASDGLEIVAVICVRGVEVEFVSFIAEYEHGHTWN